MYSLYDGDHIESDLEKLPHQDLIEAFLDEVSCTSEALAELTQWPGECSHPHFNSKGIDFLQKQGFNIYRIRPLSRSLRDYRIVYAFNPKNNRIYILAVVAKPEKKDEHKYPEEMRFNYERDHQITERICREYDFIGISRIS